MRASLHFPGFLLAGATQLMPEIRKELQRRHWPGAAATGHQRRLRVEFIQDKSRSFVSVPDELAGLAPIAFLLVVTEVRYRFSPRPSFSKQILRARAAKKRPLPAQPAQLPKSARSE
jgi:hypothetical protein